MEPSPRPFLPPPVHAVTGPPLASPIDLSSGEAGAGKVTVISHVTALERRPHGWTPTGDAGALLLGPVTAALHSLVIRIPGEHRINGLQTSAELQLRYIPEEGTQVALAIPVVSGPDAAALEPILGGVLDVRRLLPAPRGVLVYAGTETIPPFQRPTMWAVSRTPLTATPEQLAHL
ncbi:MAG TPA: hypothetical protein VMM13_02015, partial [Euzebya sp.]|nr:hypothetical protein [Euzebya sp.]